MFVESHVQCNVEQMAGRLREGVDTLYIVTDSIDHEDQESVFEWHTTKDGTLIKYYNKELQSLFKSVILIHQSRLLLPRTKTTRFLLTSAS